MRIDRHRRVKEAFHLKRRVVCEWIDRSSDHVFDIERGNNPKIDLAINPAKGQIVDLVAEGRNIVTLGRVHMHSENIVPSPIHMLRQLKGERSITTLVLAELLPVDPYRRSRHRPFEIDKNPLTSLRTWQLEMPAVRRNELILLIIEGVPWQRLIRVRNHNARERPYRRTPAWYRPPQPSD